MKIDLVYLNDVHGYLDLHSELFYNSNEEIIESVGGYARIATLLNGIRENNKNTLLFDGGDTFHGTLPIVTSKGQALIPILNKLQFNAVVGHWDFGYGPEQLKKLLSQLNYPMLGFNVYKDDGSLFFQPFLKIEIEDLKIGIIGICSDIVDKTMPKHFSKGLKFTNGIEELPSYITQLRDEGSNLIMVLSHNGYPQDMSMLEKVSGVDVCLSAHTHNRLYEPSMVNNTILIQCGCHGSFLGHLKLDIKDKSIKSHEYELIKVVPSLVPDKEIAALVSDVLQPYAEMNKNIVGATSTTLHRYNTLNSSMDNLLLSAVKFVSNAQIAFSNGWRYGAPIDAGNISEMDLYNIIPMNPPVSTVDLSGKEIIDLLEENFERTFSSDPMKQMGGYVKRCIGLSVNIRIENPAGYRIQEIYFNDKHLELDSYYSVAFVTSQGVPNHLGKNRQELKIKAVEAMISFLDKHPLFTNQVGNTFNLV